MVATFVSDAMWKSWLIRSTRYISEGDEDGSEVDEESADEEDVEEEEAEAPRESLSRKS